MKEQRQVVEITVLRVMNGWIVRRPCSFANPETVPTWVAKNQDELLQMLRMAEILGNPEPKERLEDALRSRDQWSERARRALELLKKLEWSGTAVENDTADGCVQHAACPCCLAVGFHCDHLAWRHKPGCELAEALKDLRFLDPNAAFPGGPA